MPESPAPAIENRSMHRLSDFDYELPTDLIAKYPLPERHHSRMLILDRSQKDWRHSRFAHLSEFLNPGDLLVANNAKVIPARLHGYRKGYSGRVEIFLLHPQNAERTIWQALLKPARRLKPGTIVLFENSSLEAKIIEHLGEGRAAVQLHWPPEQSLEELLAATGTLPIPPYLERQAEALDDERYQTVFAKVSGAQAAPTAGLHFTPAILQELQANGIGFAEITLHVSAGTFRPVLTENIAEHRMDPEYYEIPPETADAIAATRRQGKRVIAIGTTVAKTLETAALLSQGGEVKAGSGWSDVFIASGFRFQVTDALLTNFHLPRSTLLMLVSAFADRELIRNAYESAIQQEYRFYSYGDCMLIL